MPPSNSDRKIRHYKSALRFRNKEGPTIRAIAVAGVALGSAALARNIADALNTDVAGIVTGYGLSDVMTEVFGGWFAFGAADRIRYTMEKFFERMRSTMPADAAPAAGDASATLSEILLAGPPKLEYLVAHSKGSLVVSHALQHYVEDLEGDESALFERLRITTLGAVVGLPPTFKKVQQYLGALDWFGRANSSLGVMHERVPEAGHHLNPGIPYHMSVAALLNGGAAHRMLPKPPAADVLLAHPAVGGGSGAYGCGQGKGSGAESREEGGEAAEPAPKVPSPAPKVASAAPKVASPAPKVSAAPRAASPAAKAASPAPKPPVEAVKQASVRQAGVQANGQEDGREPARDDALGKGQDGRRKWQARGEEVEEGGALTSCLRRPSNRAWRGVARARHRCSCRD